MSDNGERKKFRTLKLNLVAAILADSDLSSSATRFASAVLLKWFHKESDECFASYDTIAEVAGMKRRATAIKAAQELEEAKWLKIEKRGRGKGGRSNTNRFIFDFDRIRNGTENVPLDDVNGTLFAQNGTESVPDPFLTPSDPSGQKEGERGKAPPAAAPPGAAPGFKEFWGAHPRSINKPVTQRLYGEIIASGRATAEELNEGARRYAIECEGKDRIYGSPNWLLNEKWKDKPTAPKRERRASRGMSAGEILMQREFGDRS